MMCYCRMIIFGSVQFLYDKNSEFGEAVQKLDVLINEMRFGGLQSTRKKFWWDSKFVSSIELVKSQAYTVLTTIRSFLGG